MDPHPQTMDTVIATVRIFTNAAELTNSQINRIIAHWLAATSEDRILIAQLYPRLFSSPATVKRIINNLHAIQQEFPSKSKGDTSDDIIALKVQIMDKLCSVPGDGPFLLKLSSATCQTSVNEVVRLFSQQFTSPSITELRRMITVPRLGGTRTRRSTYGRSTWLIRCVNNNEIVCAANCSVRSSMSYSFIEVPLLGTHSGYQRKGMARLLIAGIKDYACQFNVDYVLVSADRGAIKFWESQQFVHLKGTVKARIMDEYTEQCQEFMGSQLMVWASAGNKTHHTSGAYVRAALGKMDAFTVEGSLVLPRPI